MPGKSRSQESMVMGRGLGVIDANGVERVVATEDGALIHRGNPLPGAIPTVYTQRIFHNTAGLDAGIPLPTMNVGDMIIGVYVRVIEAWDGDTAALSLGSGSSYNTLINGQTVKSTGLVDTVEGAIPTAIFSAAVPHRVKVATTGEVTKGEAEITILYLDTTL